MDLIERSSSNDISSAPNSDNEGLGSVRKLSNTIIVSRDVSSNFNSPNNVGSKDIGGTVVNGTAARQEPTPKQRKPRKKKDPDATPTEKKEKSVRRPRGTSTAVGSTRKKLKTEAGTPVPVLQSVPPTPETAHPRPSPHVTVGSAALQNATPDEGTKITQNGFSNTKSSMPAQQPVLSQYNPTPPPPPPPPPTHIARPMAYDPVRGMTVPRNTELTTSSTVSISNLSTPPRTIYNPSTSPAISSIINPPEPDAEIKPHPQPYQPMNSPPPANIFDAIKAPDTTNTMDVDNPTPNVEVIKRLTPEAAPSKPAPKPRAKEQPPPLPTGSGLLSSSLFGGDSGMDSKSATDKGTSIVLHIDLKNPSNKVINFARMAEEKYGFAALYPRQTAQRERLAKVAAAGAALERAGVGTKGTPAGESGDDDVSVDIDRDSDNDGDVAMSGMNGTGEAVNSGTDGPVPKRRKRKDEYDADDPFVDDSEMLWEAQAAASKDGFFVYCGPLVPEGEKATVERADGTVKRGRGRGRGGGPGSRGGRGAAAAAARETEGGAGRGGGPGSRGGGVTRKPRITKAERAQREMEKKQREEMAVLAAKPPNYQA